MYLLLNNNKYLDQIVNSLFFCLRDNDVPCKLVNEIEKKKEVKLLQDKKNSNNFNSKEKPKENELILPKNLNKENNLFEIAEKGKPILAKNSNTKNNLFEIAEKGNPILTKISNNENSLLEMAEKNKKILPNASSTKNNLLEIAEKSPIINQKNTNKNVKNPSINKFAQKNKKEEFNIEEYLKNPQEQSFKLPETFNLASIVSETTGTSSNFQKSETTKIIKSDNSRKSDLELISKEFNININTNIDIDKDIEDIPIKKEEIPTNNNDKEDIYIIFNINSIKDEDLPEKFFVYNFEQLITDRKWDYSYFIKCKKALLVLDYSLENIKIFDQRGITAYHLPFGWCRVMDPSYKLTTKNIDIVFLGSINKNRLNVITDISLRNPKANIYIHNKCFKDDFEKVTCSSKVGINIHYYEGKTILELTRIIPLICAGVIVVSERSNDIFYDKIFNKLIKFCKREDIAKVVKEEIYKYDIDKALKKKKKLKKILNFENILKQNIGVFKKFI